ncbi:hypothetical protein CMV_007261 [Castanea mollissima]|uniref:AAA+ ATPase domain-containing protein n=1 Tax=Castanea mollissima TaxID=60419 RepID=A0A8J4RND9_9ROSI|nr:hypothetical protein CMV_007261 [Castanea mollissima]
MELVGATVGALVATTSELLCSCANSKTNTTFNLHSNLAAVEKEMESLTVHIEVVKRETEAAEKEGKEIKAQVVIWLKDVETLQPRVKAIQGQMVNNKRPSRCFLNCRKRYRASREVEETLKEIRRLLPVAASFDSGVVSLTRVPRAVECIPGPSIQGQTTASKKLDETMKALYDGCKRIGIWGLGGVGKTTLVKNLNNELRKASTQPFGIVIWATVSKNLVIKNVQKQIAERLNLEVKMDESVQRMASRLYERLEKEENFLLILDDVWAKIDLDTLGVPVPEVHKGCRIILTSRLKEVCRTMTTDLNIKVEVLNDVEAWQLFCQKAGDVAHREEIKPLAEAIVRECSRLPLAIITVGATMRDKKKVELWRHALKELQRSVPSIEGIEAEVYKPLKLSYDSLQGNNIKSCFLYCCLFPEDCEIRIHKLVQYWRAEGLIDVGQNWANMDEGISLIENLKDSCLLEEGRRRETVKMHDIVRDVAIWISSSSEDGCNSLVRSGIGLSEISAEDFSNSNSLDRVSFLDNNITRLPDCMIQCSKASTLLLQHNKALDTVPEKFLQGFKALKVLDLSRTSIRSLPHSLLQLRDLRVLLLCDCPNLEELPSLGTLTKLRELDLESTSIANLPRGIENLRLDEVLEDFIESDASFVGLKSLEIANCPTSLGQGGGCAARCDLLPNLEKFHLSRMENLNSISELAGHLGLRVNSLKSIEVQSCPRMKYLLSCGDFIQTLPNLEEIEVSDCENFEELFNYESGQNISPDPMVPKLQILQLWDLPKFKTLCRYEETWPCLEQVVVWGCKGLRRLPLTNQNAVIESSKPELLLLESLPFETAQTSDSEAHWYCNLKLGSHMIQEMIGGELMDFIIVLHDSKAVKTFCSRMHFSLGAGCSAAAGPVGRVLEADLRAGDRGSGMCYTYSCSKGAFVGVSLEGNVVATRMDTNLHFYGDPYLTTSDILLGMVSRPKAAEPLYAALEDLFFSLQ